MTTSVDALNEFGRWLVGHLWPISVELAILAGVVVAALAALRPASPAVRHLFWCLVLVKPMVTILVASPVSLYGVFQIRPEPVVLPALAVDAVEGETTGRLPLADRQLVAQRRAHDRKPIVAECPPVELTATLDRYGIAAVVYLLAVVGFGFRVLLGCAYVSFLRRTAQLQRDGPLVELLARTARRLGVTGRATVAVSGVVHSPVLAGIVRPTIILPERLAQALSPRQLEYVLAHELSHLGRWDNLLLLVQRVAETVLFFHPVIWLCGWAMRREAEAACDERVLSRLGGAAGYADSLTRVAEMRGPFAGRLLANTFAGAESNLAVRVRRILRGPGRHVAAGWRVATIIIFVAIGCLGLPAAKARTAKPVTDHVTGAAARSGDAMMCGQLDYGFRYDPMMFVGNDESLEGALVRKFVFDDAKPGDAQMIQDELAALKVFEKPDPAEGGAAAMPFKVNCANLLRIVELGGTADHPEVRRVLELLDSIPANPRQPLGGDVLHAFCLLGRGDHPAVRYSLRRQMDRPQGLMDPLEGCPWTPSGSLPGLWAARNLEDVGPLVVQSLTVIRDQMDGTGCLAFNDPWSFVNCAAHIEHPIAREILIRQVPMILRAQQPDGGWGENTFKVLAALTKHGLLDELRAKPPLPPDWQVERSIPSPEGDLWGLLWDGELLWTGGRTGNEAIAISTDDGRVVRRIKLPDGHGRWLGLWNGKLAVTQGSPSKGGPKRLLQIDPQGGCVLQDVSLSKLEHVGGVVQVDGQVRVFDSFFGWVFALDAATPGELCELDLPRSSPLPMTANAAGEGALWYVDGWVPWVVKCDHEGRLLDWAERPFGGWEGVAWDGEQLWAIDRANGRICVVKKTDTAPRPSLADGQRAGAVSMGRRPA